MMDNYKDINHTGKESSYTVRFEPVTDYVKHRAACSNWC